MMASNLVLGVALLVACAGALAIAGLAVASVGSNRSARRFERWQGARPMDDDDERRTGSGLSALSRSVVSVVGQGLSSLSRLRAGELKETSELLSQAGFRSAAAGRTFAGTRVVLEVALFIMAANFARVFDLSFAQTVSILVLMFALGRFLPTYLLRRVRDRRQRRIVAVLPEFIDLLSICLGGGLGVTDAIERVVEEVRELEPAFGDELNVMVSQIAAGKSEDEALGGLVQRCGTSELRSLVSVLSQSGRYGSRVSESLDEYAEAIRSSRLAEAEGQAETTPTKMLIPTALILISTLAVVLGPMFWRVGSALNQ